MVLVIRHQRTGFNLPLVPWEGGASYWAQFPKAHAAGWSDPTFFPIAIFAGKTDGTHPSQLASLGINVYMAAEHQPPISNATADVFVMAQSTLSVPGEWTVAEIGSDPKVVGWFVYDECEQGEGRCGAWSTDAERLSNFSSWCASYRALNDGRFLFANFGNGVLNTFWATQGGVSTMPQWMALIDGCCCDKYCYTSGGVQFEIGRSGDWSGTEAQANSSAAYGWLVDQMRTFDASNTTRRPQWVFIESKMPYLAESTREIILYAEIEGAVFSAIAHEARGIAYFQHNGFYGSPAYPAIDPNTGTAPTQETYSLVDGPFPLKSYVSNINAKVTALAPVLNTQSYQWNFGAANIDTMLKVYGGFAYIFASVGIGGSLGSKTFTLPTGITGTSVEVLNESRTLTITSGQFTDSFAAEYSHHIYKIDQ